MGRIVVGDGQVTHEEPAMWRKSGLDDHRTAPHKLLSLWPSVRPLLGASDVSHSDDYVMKVEDRGPLRLRCRGDEGDGTQLVNGADSSAVNGRSGVAVQVAASRTDDSSSAGFAHTSNNEIRRSGSFGVGVLRADGEIDLDPANVRSLCESYTRHIHIMHPFLDKRQLMESVDRFIERHGVGHPRAVESTDRARWKRRQRTDGWPEHETRTERSPGNAIIYLVLALGKMCQHQVPLQAIGPERRWQADAARGAGCGSPESTTSATDPTLGHHGSRNRTASTDGSPPIVGPFDRDVVPGIAYYAKAAEILGEQGDGNDLAHAQMFLLAGLYKGQLARVRESMSWFTLAGRAIMILLDRRKLRDERRRSDCGDVREQHELGRARIKDTKDALVVMASWTCLQLESDILAELPLPSSQIRYVEDTLPMPDRAPVAEPDQHFEPDDGREDHDIILLYYTAQLFLRRRLDKVHRDIYGSECLSRSLSEVREILEGHGRVLDDWRNQLPPMLGWNDDDAPPSDILAARLRAKFWGARYVVNRPFLDYALHIMPRVREGGSVEESARDGHGNPRDKADIHLFRAIQQLGDSDIWRRAEQCIVAAMHSTEAFDGVPGRLIVTNIHGTAHAQFGNMLVLSAAYNNPLLRRLVPVERFRYLMQRTITFLRRLTPISPTCAADGEILEKFYNCIFDGPAGVGNVPARLPPRTMAYDVDDSSSAAQSSAAA